MRTVLGTLAVTFAVVVIAGAIFVFSGLYDVSATAPHWRVVHWIMETARARSIAARAVNIAVPAGLDDPAKMLIGTEHFAAHCAVCHGAPGVPRGDIAEGLYPQPPNLAEAAKRYSPGELFWILKHGIKMSGMPAWADHSDEELWGTVAFLQKLPGMTEEDYAKLIMASVAHGGHHHDGGERAAPTRVDSRSSPYAGEQTRSIKALSEDDVSAMRNGEGMGLAKAAELNGYPGPVHVIEFAKELRLTPDQVRRVTAIHDRMSAAAKPLGSQIIDREQELDRLFAQGQITAERLTADTTVIGELQGRLRSVHLTAHLETRNVLTSEQLAKYQQLRGYGNPPAPPYQPQDDGRHHSGNGMVRDH